MARIVYNKIIPFKGFTAVNLFGVVFIRKDAGLTEDQLQKVLVHEAIHTAQMKELAYIFFYLVYFFEWIVRFFIDYSTAYRRISFEQEAYHGEGDANWLNIRRHYEQWRK